MIKIYDSYDAKLKDLGKNPGGKIGIYRCGPTVYDKPHIGHGRSAVAFDVVRKYFIYKGYKVNYVSNYTDIDDKMIDRANLRGIKVSELADEVIPQVEKAFGALGVMMADKHPKATDYIDGMIEMIKDLEEKGFAYVLEDGVYYDITKFDRYGKLSKQNMESLQSGNRNKLKDSKRNEQDFALWKFEKPGEPSWDSPWGKGRPGWHIECSAMSRSILGDSFDIHTGGIDLIFPHHECEIAQSEPVTGVRMADFWMYNGFVNIDSEKMSKSLGNFKTLEEMYEKFHPMVMRYLFLQTHYRAPIEYSEAALTQAKNGLMRIYEFYRRLQEVLDSEVEGEMQMIGKLNLKLIEDFEKHMDEDFETNNALAAIYEYIREVNKLLDEGKVGKSGAEVAMKQFSQLNEILGVLVPEKDPEISEEVKKMINDREQARKAKDWTRADELRAEIDKKGVILEDTPKGTRYRLRLF